ncbi:MAG: hypothetical protein ACTHK0_07465 [Ginsengibacter sp.]
MKFYIIALITAISLSSCLKDSISDAMLASTNAEKQGSTATLSYEVNGSAVSVSVNDATNWNGSYHILSCEKNPGYYALGSVSNSGEFVFVVYTDSLKTGNYKHTSSFGEMFFVSYYGTDAYVQSPSDSMSLHITSYNNGRVSGNFSGVLTPMISAGNPANVYGTPGSISITNGSFKNVPVIY